MTQKHAAKKGGAGEAVAISAGLAALAAASYYFWGPKGKEHRKGLKSWSIKMRGEVVEKIEKLQDVSEPVYRGIVDAVAAQYAREARASKTEIMALADDLKRTWRSIVSSTQKKPSRTTKRGGTAGRSKAARTKKKTS